MVSEAEISSLEHQVAILFHDAEVTPAEVYMICDVVKLAYASEVFEHNMKERYILKEK